jgi:hypothetical protein
MGVGEEESRVIGEAVRVMGSMSDPVSRGFVREIRRLAEQRLGRPLTDQELRGIETPRSFLALEMICDYVRDPALTARQVEQYLAEL